MGNDNAVEFECVSKVYVTEKVVDDVSFQVREGEIFILIGPSGCGKTTTLKMINQLIPHTSGNIYVRGKDVTELDPVELRRSIGYVIQYIGLLPHLTIRENITFVLQLMKYPKKQRWERAEELIQTVGLSESYLDRYPRELSGGQQQRVGVARALAANPEILLMDEPFGAVDPITREQLQNELLHIQETINKTIIFVTHDMQEAFKVGNQIGIMRKGKFIEIGTAMEIIKSEDQFVRAFVGQGAVLDALDAVPVTQIINRSVPKFYNGQTVSFKDTDLFDGWDNIFVLNERDICKGYLNLKDLDLQGRISDEKVSPLPPPCLPNSSVKSTIENMLWNGRSWLPVVNEDEIFLGVVTFEACAALMTP
jgi:osmoprotectant transport system ATP-binding protein